jgi:hypothetical protein
MENTNNSNSWEERRGAGRSGLHVEVSGRADIGDWRLATGDRYLSSQIPSIHQQLHFEATEHEPSSVFGPGSILWLAYSDRYRGRVICSCAGVAI